MIVIVIVTPIRKAIGNHDFDIDSSADSANDDEQNKSLQNMHE